MTLSLSACRSRRQQASISTCARTGRSSTSVNRRVLVHGQAPKAPKGNEILLATAVAASCILAPDAAVAGESISPELADAFQAWLVRPDQALITRAWYDAVAHML